MTISTEMIEFHYETNFSLEDEEQYRNWIRNAVKFEDSSVEKIDFVFCDDKYLLQLNLKHLKHNSLTDIITFPYKESSNLAADIFISVDRVKANAKDFKVDVDNELKRVMAHGVLHLLGYNDKTPKEQELMRIKEEQWINMFHVEQ